jgi:hypothetical protein
VTELGDWALWLGLLFSAVVMAAVSFAVMVTGLYVVTGALAVRAWMRHDGDPQA